MKTRPILSFKNCYNCFLVYVALTKFEINLYLICILYLGITTRILKK